MVYNFTKTVINKYFSQEVFSKIFPQIYCYLSIFLNILGNFISQENLSVAAANRCKVFQVFIFPKIPYSVVLEKT